MIGISWNIRGLNSRIKRSSLRKLIIQNDPHFVFIQETKMEVCNSKIIKSMWNAPNIEWLFSPSVGNSGGLITMWNGDFFKSSSHRIERNWIAICGLLPSCHFNGTLINIYNPCLKDERAIIWNDIIDFHSMLSYPCLLLGDFNEVLDPLERGSQVASQTGIKDFHNFIQRMCLSEINCSNGCFTWHRGHAKSKLDRLLISPEWVGIFPHMAVTIMKRSISDHNPLLIKTEENDWGPKPFRFQDCWLLHPGCMETIKEIWEKHKPLGFGEKLKEVKTGLKSWNTSVFGKIDHQIYALEERIHEIDMLANNNSLTDDEISERRSAQSELWGWLKRKETYWAQNSRAKWVKEGDKNTKYFHALASSRKRRNCITSISANGITIDDFAGIQNEAVSFFRNIFKEDHSCRPIFSGLKFRILSDEQARSLIAPFSRMEIDSAVDSCNAQKAPGPDGFNFRFIKAAWDLIKEDIYGIIDEFYSSSCLPKGSNVAFIALIAKCENPEEFKDFRPISMVGCVYKIIAKLLSRRLQGVMNFLIGPHQSSFIAGRQILDGALITGELIESCQRMKIKSTILKLDFHKAFDSVAWSFLEWTLSREGPKITHLQYADDTIIFCPPNMSYLHHIKKALILFQLASGLQVNFHKSSIHGIHVDNSWLLEAARSLLCKVGVFPITYLGLPIGGNSSRLALWNPILKKIESKLATWKGKLLSMAGRLALIKASIASLPLYYMSLFPAPKGVIEMINKLQRQFLWCGDVGKSYLALVSWDKVVLPRVFGGLNCGNLFHRNISLLAKWIWRFLNEPHALWQKVIKAKYNYLPVFLPHELEAPAKGGPWRNMCASLVKYPPAHDLVRSKIRRNVGNGSKILFWHEIWLGPSPLKAQFPRLYKISSLPNAPISSFGSWTGRDWAWSFEWSRPFRPRDVVEWSELMAALALVCLSVNDEDSCVWALDKTGAFSVKSLSFELAKASLSQAQPCTFNWKKIWKGLIPPRVEIFTWLAVMGRLNTRSKLASLNIIPQEEIFCILCNEQTETSDHLLLHCDFSCKLWRWWLNLWGMSWVFPSNLKDALEQWVIYGNASFFKKIWVAIFSIIIWSIWKERNDRIFNSKSSPIDQIIELSLLRLSWWIKGWDVGFPHSSDEILRNPSCLLWSQSNGLLGNKLPQNPNVDWVSPPLGTLKWNVDASLNSSLSLSAIGGVLRDHNGCFKCLFSSPIPCIEINSAEILAIYRACKITMSMDVLKSQKLIIESDSANAVRWCNEEQGGPWSLNFQLNYIRNARRDWLQISIIHKGRGSNMVADALAKQGLTRSDEFLAWL